MVDKQALAAECKARGNAAFQAGNFAEAVKHFTEAIEHSPMDHVLYSNRSGAHASLKNFKEALKDAEMCVKIKPDWPKGYSRKGLALFELRMFSQASEAYKAGLQIDPNNTALQDGLGQVMQNMKKMETQMERIYAMSLGQKPKFKKYMDEDPNFIKAVSAAIQQIQTNPSALKLGIVGFDSRVQEALKFLLSGGEEDEEELERERMERQQQEMKKKKEEDEARKKAETEASITPAQREAQKFKLEGNELYKQHRFTEAHAAYDRAIAADPTDITYLTNKAAVYLEEQKYDECLAICQKALDMRYDVRADFSKVAKVYCRMATCYRRMKKYDMAIQMYHKALTEENDRQTRNALKEVERLKEKTDREEYIDPEKAEEHRQRGNELYKAGSFPEAKKEYDEAIRRNPSDSKLYSNRAAAFIKLAAYPSAMADIEKALELDPTFAKAWARKGAIHFLLKEYNKALSAYQRGLQEDPENVECRNGMDDVVYKIQNMSSSNEIDKEQIERSMNDPEIQQIMSDPQFRLILDSVAADPQRLPEVMKDPKIALGIQKLMAAGILRVG